jgi:antitoxin component of MazEF toxin-antitoxin module
LGIRIPKTLADQVQLFRGERVQMAVRNDQIVIEALSEDVNLDALLQTITPEMIDRSYGSDMPTGKEML